MRTLTLTLLTLLSCVPALNAARAQVTVGAAPGEAMPPSPPPPAPAQAAAPAQAQPAPAQPAAAEPPSLAPPELALDPNDPRTTLLLQDELTRLREERRQVSLAGPIVLTAIGGGLLVGGLPFLLIGLTADCDLDAYNNDYGYDETSEGNCEDVTTAFAVIGGIASGAGAITLAIGLPMLFGAIGERREIGRRMREVQLELDRRGAPRASLSAGPRLRGVPIVRVQF